MLALRLTRGRGAAVQLRRLLVALASAGTGFLLLSALGYALAHPHDPGAAVLRLSWCTVPLAATAHFATAVARTDPATKPRPGLSAIGLGPARLMLIAATTTSLATTLGSMLALLFFLHLRGDLTGMPFDGAAADFLAAKQPLPMPATLTLLALLPVISSVSVATVLRPRETGRGIQATRPAGGRKPDTGPGTPASDPTAPAETPGQDLSRALPWGIATLAAGLAAEAYAARAAAPAGPALPGGLAAGPAGVLLGWALTATGLALAGPGLTHLCGRLLQSVRPGALRLLAGRILMAEATRIGRPLGVVCAVASAAYATGTLYDPNGPSFGPLSTLGALLVAGCTVATLLTAALEAKHARAETTAALVRLGAPATTLRTAAALRAGALLALFGPLTLLVADLAALPLGGR